MLQVLGGGIHSDQSSDPAAEAANKGSETLMRAVRRLQARHSSNAGSGMPQGVQGRQLAAGTSRWHEQRNVLGDP
jgi:hypothetical protein